MTAFLPIFSGGRPTGLCAACGRHLRFHDRRTLACPDRGEDPPRR